MKKFFLFLFIPLIFVGCESIATQGDISSVKERVSNIQERVFNVEKDFYSTSKAIAGKFSEIQNDYNDKIDTLNSKIETIKKDRAIIVEKLSSLEDEINLLKGKIDETNYNLDKKINEQKEGFETYKVETKRDIEGLKKTYNDIISSIATLNNSITLIQKDLSALRKSQEEIVKNIEKISDAVNKNSLKNTQIEKKLNKNSRIFLNELTKQESQIHFLKSKISQIEKTGIYGEEKLLKRGKKYYVVKKGDYLGKIARKFHTTVKKIKKANKLKSDIIYPNQKLLIP